MSRTLVMMTSTMTRTHAVTFQQHQETFSKMTSVSGPVTLTCGRCLNYFPNVSIISCGTVLVLCKACHRRLHPGCVKAVSIATYADRMCRFCREVPAILLCPLCGQTDDDKAMLALCRKCSDKLHHNGTSIHTDHIMTIPA